MRLFLRVARAALCATVAAAATPACYSSGGGTSPPPASFYFPVGLAVSSGGRILYAVNSDFDLQWNGGTLQSYDLQQLRQDADALIAYNLLDPVHAPDLTVAHIPFISGKPPARCKGQPIPPELALGEGCAPPVDSSNVNPPQHVYIQQSIVVGAFATDLQLLPGVPGNTDRLFFPVRGTATLTYADVPHDDGTTALVHALTPESRSPSTPAPNSSFAMNCGGGDGCSAENQVGDDPNSYGNTRQVTMPGEPFGMAVTSPKPTAIAVTHQTSNSTSLLTSGFGSPGGFGSQNSRPTMQFVLNGVPQGGNGIAAVPHDPDAVDLCDVSAASNAGCVRPAFLETSRAVAEVDLLRFYNDDITFATEDSSTLQRPYLVRERVYTLTANSIGSDSRGIVIDPTPRLACKARLPATATQQDRANCGKIPARVFFANRTPPSLVVGEIGELSSDGSYDPDALLITGNVPVDSGPSRVYLAPIVDPQGFLELRVFVVCFDSSEIFIYDPEDLATNGSHATPQGYIQTGPATGPFAMAFDPMPAECIAIADPNSPAWKAAPGSADYDASWRTTQCPQVPSSGLGPYRFGYIGNFTKSFMQMIDLDAHTQFAPYTFQQIVFTLGQPTLPKGQ